MKKILFLALLFVSLAGFCQTRDNQYYIYNIVSFEGQFTREDFKVFYDDGREVKRLRNEDGKKVRFSTPAGALMYFISQGWEMSMDGSTSKGASYNGTGGTVTSTYWILRKPCTKAEFEEAIDFAKMK